MTEPSPPRPQGRYRSAVVVGSLVMVAGMSPRRGNEMIASGRVGEEITIAQARELVAVCAHRALTAARRALADLHPDNRLVKCAKGSVFLVTHADFGDHSLVADAVSEVVETSLGPGSMGVRTTVGVLSLPGGAPCEVELTFEHAADAY